MYLIISVLIFIICVLLIMIVLIQNSKGGGLTANFSSSNQYMGVRKTTDFLEKATWVLACAMMLLSIVGSFVLPRNNAVSQESSIENQVRNIDPSLPVFPAATTDATATDAAAADDQANN